MEVDLDQAVALGAEPRREYLDGQIHDWTRLEFSQQRLAEGRVETLRRSRHRGEERERVVVEDVELVPGRRRPQRSRAAAVVVVLP